MFVPERSKDTENPVHNGYRFVIDKRRDDICYWKFSRLQKGLLSPNYTSGKVALLWTAAEDQNYNPLSKPPTTCRYGWVFLLPWKYLDWDCNLKSSLRSRHVDQHDASQLMIPCSSNIAEGWHHGSHSMMSCLTESRAVPNRRQAD